MNMEQLKNLPIDIQDFEKIRRDNYLYVDKTAQMYKLVTTWCYYFLSRPRRFGKSLLNDTRNAPHCPARWTYPWRTLGVL